MLGLGRLFSSFRDLYKELNPATLTGAVDVIVVELSDGSFVCSPFYVRFGKMGVLRSREKLVDISINDESVSLHMKLAESGEAYFVEDTFEEQELPLHLATSPIPMNGAQLMADGLAELKRQAALSDIETHDDAVSIPLSSPIVSPLASNNPITFVIDPEKTPTVESTQQLSGHAESMFQDAGAKSIIVPSADRRQQKKLTRLRRENELFRQRAMHSGSFSWHGGSLPNLAISGQQQQNGPSVPNSKTPDPQIQRLPDPEPRKFRLSKSFAAHHQLELEFPEIWNEINGDDSNSIQLTPLPPNVENVENVEEVSTNRSSNIEQIGEIALSLCGGIENSSVTDATFKSKEVSFDQLNTNPDLLLSKDLVVKIENRYYNYQVATPILLSLLVFQRPLSETTVNNLVARYHSVQNSDEQKQNGPLKDTTVVDGLRQNPRPVSTSSYYSSWFSWRRASSMEPSGVTKPVDNKIVNASDGHNLERPSESALSLTSEKEDELSIEMMSDELKDAHDISMGFDDRGALSDSELDQAFERPTTSSRYRKSLYLNSDQLKTLNLKPNQANRAIFSVTTKYQGTCSCECEIYLWRWYDKIVISDIDGTITKSDVLGHIMPIVGRQWEHSNVADLFTRIVDNGYRVMYLTARAIGQSQWTKDYLKSIKQDNRSLPDGPLQLSPTSLFNAFHSEVIERKPEIFKTKCLRDIKALFPETSSPFYAGFGNKSTDEIAYRAAGVPSNRIFTINHTGEVRFADKELRSSYQHISDLVDHIFPPLPVFKKTNNDQLQTTTEAPTLAISATSINPLEEYTNFSYWRQPFSNISVNVAKFVTDKPHKSTRKESTGSTKKK